MQPNLNTENLLCTITTSPKKTRIPVRQFNSQQFAAQVKQMKPVLPDEENLPIHRRILYCLVAVEHAPLQTPEILEVTQKGRKKTLEPVTPNFDFIALSFTESLNLELQSLQLGPFQL